MLRHLMLFIVINNFNLKRFLTREYRTWFDNFIVKRIIKCSPWKNTKFPVSSTIGWKEGTEVSSIVGANLNGLKEIFFVRINELTEW